MITAIPVFRLFEKKGMEQEKTAARWFIDYLDPVIEILARDPELRKGPDEPFKKR